jgi:hypothetical protein
MMRLCFPLAVLIMLVAACTPREKAFQPSFKLVPASRLVFNSFVDCNMAEAWIGDTLRIFPGKYGEDPVWGEAHELKYASGLHAEEVFAMPPDRFQIPKLPPNAPPHMPGLHGAVWFETLYQDVRDASGNTLYAIYHNENYPETLPFDSATGKGYTADNWPQGLRGPESAAAVCRIGIMKSTDGGRSWEDRGILIEDLNDRMIRKPHNVSNTFAGGVGDPSAVVSGDYLYLFYGEYSYPGTYHPVSYDATTEWAGQCISVARIRLTDLDNPEGKAKRWDGSGFNAPHDGIGKPITSLQIPPEEGGGAASQAGHYYWGPSVSWNDYLQCWVMLMARVEEPSWRGSNIYISFNPHADLGTGNNSQQWTTPVLLISKPGRVLWYPSLQPLNTPEDIANKYTCLRLGRRARLFVKDSEANQYSSEFIIEFETLK